MDKNRIEFRGKPKQLEFLQEALEELPDTVINFKERVINLSSPLLIAEYEHWGKDYALLFAKSPVQIESINLPEDASDVNLVLEQKVINFLYRGRGYQIHFYNQE